MTLWLKKLLSLLPILAISGIALVLMGIGFLCTFQTILNNEFVIDYTNCSSYRTDTTCRDSRNEGNEDCVCYQRFYLPMSLGETVILYYELETFDQSQSDYVNSKDDSQLQGVLNINPSPNCEPYRYVNINNTTFPIAPCGLIADSMFNDSYSIYNNETELSFQISGMLRDEDKVGFHNPERIENAMKFFQKPKNWVYDLWQIDRNHPENNGFQNEIFIGWMKTEWKRKPFFRLTGRGLPSGNYALRVKYNYPPSRYDGPRKVILVSSDVRSIIMQGKLIIGIISLVVGIILGSVAIILFVMRRKITKGSNEDNGNPINGTANFSNSSEAHRPAEEDPLAGRNRSSIHPKGFLL